MRVRARSNTTFGPACFGTGASGKWFCTNVIQFFNFKLKNRSWEFVPRPNTTIETVTSLQNIEQTRIQVPQEAVELYGKSSQDTDQNVNLAKITATRKASKVTTWNTCGACCWLNRFWQVCFFARMNVRRSTGKPTKRQRREHQVYISLSSLAEQDSSRPTHASEMWFCKTWQIPQHKTKTIKMCKTNILSL